MPVLVTAADRGIGPELVAALRADDADVRAFATGAGDVGALRATGARVAVGDLDDEGHLDAAMTDAHTVIVPTRTWVADPARLRLTAATIARAAASARVRRLVLVSVVGADPGAEPALLAAFGDAEVVVADEGRRAAVQTLVVRTDGIVEHDLADLVTGVAGCDDEVLAPVGSARLVAGLVALDAARSSRRGGHALFTALGSPAPLATWRRRLAGLAGDPDPEAGGLVGRRWLAPDRRADLRAILAGRGGPPTAGADLWAFAGSDAS